MTYRELEIEKLVKNSLPKNQLQAISPKFQKVLPYISYFKVQKEVGNFPDALNMSIIKVRCQLDKMTHKKENDRLPSRWNRKQAKSLDNKGPIAFSHKISGTNPVFHFILNPALPVYIKF